MKTEPTTMRTNTDWLGELQTTGAAREAALADLRAIVLAGLPYALSGWLSPADPQFEALAEDVAQETLLRVLDKLNSFEHRSHFTTWVHKIAVRVALTELRRRRWADTSLEALTAEKGEGMMMAAEPTPGRIVEQNDMLGIVQRLLMEELTHKQRLAMMAVNVEGMPLEVVAQQMGMTRNALYKLLHDARLRLKRRMEREGLTAADVLASFQ
ncbi:MAG: sigma-70 family RNA polymerase sigma factor [Chloroflexi bacterium]|nr:sigma-70 family RNA polymerase sigma factor [Chloroflexota bacterium]